jgi:hypothetical protein
MTTEFRGGSRLWEEIQGRAKKATSLIAVVGYVGRHPAKVLRWRKGDTLIADLSEENVRRGICSAKGALELLDVGVRILHSPMLHAKVYLFPSAAIVCSANASETSKSRQEAGMLVTGQGLDPVRAWVAAVQADPATTRLGRTLLKELAKKEPKTTGRKPRGGPSSSKNGANESHVWLIRASDDSDESRAEREAAATRAGKLVNGGAVEDPSDVDWFNNVGKSTFQRVKPGDRVVEVWDAEPYYPHGKIVGIRTCLLPVDLGSRFGSRRYRLALTDRAIVSRRLSDSAVGRLRRALALKGGSRVRSTHKATSSATAVLENLLRS